MKTNRLVWQLFVSYAVIAVISDLGLRGIDAGVLKNAIALESLTQIFLIFGWRYQVGRRLTLFMCQSSNAALAKRQGIGFSIGDGISERNACWNNTPAALA